MSIHFRFGKFLAHSPHAPMHYYGRSCRIFVGKKKKKTRPLMRVWKARSVFWDLEYWSLLHNPHSLYLMRITKNVCESLFGTLLNMPEKTKDGPKARNDFKFMGIRRELHPPSDDDDEPEEEEDTETQNSRK